MHFTLANIAKTVPICSPGGWVSGLRTVRTVKFKSRSEQRICSDGVINYRDYAMERSAEGFSSHPKCTKLYRVRN